MNIKFSAAIIFSFLITVSLYSQSTEAVKYLHDSSQCIQFGIDNLSLRTFNQKGISYKMHLSENNALLFGVKLAGSTTTEEMHTKKYSHDTLISAKTERYDPLPSINIECSAEYIWYFPTGSDLFLFMGGGPDFRYDQREYTYSFHKNWSAGLIGTIGVEWFVSQKISIHSEYYVSAYYNFSKSNDWSPSYSTSDYRIDEKSTSFNLQSGNVLFGLSVYF